MANTWLNSDGLYVKFGTSEATVGAGGEFEDHFAMKTVIEVLVPDLTKISATLGGTILDDNITVPKGARIEEIQVEVETAATSGGSATFDFGLIRTDRVTELDFNGFVAAAAVATLDTAGKRLTLINGTTAFGALIGTTLANPGYLVVNSNTAVFTAGALRLRVFYYMPGQS